MFVNKNQDGRVSVSSNKNGMSFFKLSFQCKPLEME